jgi:hypothetical protein
MMTRQHYELIASIFRGTKPLEENYENVDEFDARYVQWGVVVLAFAIQLDSDNERFDRKRFLDACTLTT